MLAIVASIFPSINRIVISNAQIQEAKVAFDRMFEFVSLNKEATLGEGIGTFDVLSVRGLSFRFPSGNRILRSVDLTLTKGEFVSIIGESGCGKSTLLQLLLKFYEPESGFILVDGRRFESIATPAWRSIVSFVPQEIKIFNGTLLFNIALSEEKEELQRAFSFCESSGFNSCFDKFPQKYLTLLGEEGINLSGGQRQLIGIARALARNPRLLLLDESTSSLDYLTEDFVIDLLKKKREVTSIILVTHRLNTAYQSDRVYTLRDGVLLDSK